MLSDLSQVAVREILDTMNDGLFLVNPSGRIVMVNQALERMLGYSREELLGQPCSVFKCDVCVVSRASGKRHWCRLFDTQREEKKSCLLRRKDGSTLHVLKNAALLTQDGAIAGAVETLTDISELDRKEEDIRGLRRILEVEQGFQGMVGHSPVMQRVFALIERAAQSDAPVIIIGESGTGKELAARAIHELGPRASGPYLECNCAALNEALLESELFGHTKGAFTGALRHRQGRFEAAHGGDLFLDEIGDVPLSTQVKLLRVLETKQLQRVGDHQPVAADVRIITATNQDLGRLVREGRFREDFFFRINVIPVHLPPLRERREDIPLLIETFIRRLQTKSGRPIHGLSPAAMARCMTHSWPGNVRELKSALEYAFVVSDTGPIETDHLPPQIGLAHPCPEPGTKARPEDGDPERLALIRALGQASGNKSLAARLLGVSRITVHNRMRKHGVDLKIVVSG